MPIQRDNKKNSKQVDEGLLNDATLDEIASKEKKPSKINSKLSPKTKYAFLYIGIAIIVFLLALLVIALMNLGINGEFRL